MSVRIESIDIKSLGPLQNFQHELKDVNLVYGKNETGKTHLVEFLIRSLFKQANYPGMRELDCVGRVTVSGLGDAAAYFSPAERKKLEDFIHEDGKALPANISRLLVVRGGELSFIDDAIKGIDKSILEDYLSNSGVINQVRSKIQPTVQNASIREGIVEGKKQGKIKDRDKLIGDLADIDHLMNRVNREFSSSVRASLQAEMTRLQEEFELQIEAKRHHAYQVKTRIDALQEELDTLPEDLIHQTDIALHDYQSASADLINLKKEFEEEKKTCSDLPWLQSALQNYQQLSGQQTSTVKSWQIILFGVMMLAGIVLVFLQQSIPASILLAAAGAVGYFAWHTSRKAAANAVQISEIEKIAADFQERFNQPLKNMAKLQTMLKEQEKAQTMAEKFERDIIDLQAKRNSLADTLTNILFQLTGKHISPEEWETRLEALIQDRKNTDKDRQVLSNELASLQVDTHDYQVEPSPVPYDESRCRALEKQIEELRENLRLEDESLNSLRQSLAASTRQDISTSWEKLIETLQDKREEKVNEYKAISAEVIGGVLLTQTLDELYREEEKSIRQGLLSPNMSRFLKQMTTHYERVDYHEGAIHIADPFSEYVFGDLSTAAQEQVLLALRLGFAARCFQGQSLFLVLDDAFQHSDWTRRQYLVDEVFNLAQEEWQIIYLTMDDHIRALFKEKALALSAKSYLEICL